MTYVKQGVPKKMNSMEQTLVTQNAKDGANSTGELKGLEKNSKKTIVLIGPLPNSGDVIGGTKVSFKDLVSILQDSGKYGAIVIDTSRPNRGKTVIASRILDIHAMVRVLWRLWRVIHYSQVVMWNVSPGGAIRAAPLIKVICYLYNKPLIIRLFGGDFWDFYKKSSALRRWSADRCILGAELVLLQTRELVNRFKKIASVKWFPTTRNMPSRKRKLPRICRRYLFIGQLRLEKGMQEIMHVSRYLPIDAKISIAGPPMSGYNVSELNNYGKLEYLGEVAPQKVPDLIEQYDALLFPSYYDGEGYPGVIIEAMQLGLPVIATNWRALPELVEHEKNGLLIPIKDERALCQAMLRLYEDSELFLKLQSGAIKDSETFRGTLSLDNLESWIQELVGG